MVVTSMTFSTCVVYNIWCLGTFNFLESKAITQCRSAICAIFAYFGASRMSLFLHSLEHPMQGLMVWLRSV